MLLQYNSNSVHLVCKWIIEQVQIFISLFQNEYFELQIFYVQQVGC